MPRSLCEVRAAPSARFSSTRSWRLELPATTPVATVEARAIASLRFRAGGTHLAPTANMQTFDRYHLDSSDRRRVGGPAAHLINDRFIRDCPVDVDAIHVAEVDLVRMERWPSGMAPSLAHICPFLAGDLRMRGWLVGVHGFDRAQECGMLMPLSAVAQRVDDYLDAD